MSFHDDACLVGSDNSKTNHLSLILITALPRTKVAVIGCAHRRCRGDPERVHASSGGGVFGSWCAETASTHPLQRG